MDLTEFAGSPISVYTDSDALADGVLVDISRLNVCFRGLPLNRVTGHPWANLTEFFTDPQAIKRVLERKCQHAANGGGIWTLPPKLWLLENEVGGWTLMYPEDY